MADSIRRWLQRARIIAERFARPIARAQTTLLLAFAYFLILGPTAALWRLVHRTPFQENRSNPSSYWKERSPLPQQIAPYRRQF